MAAIFSVAKSSLTRSSHTPPQRGGGGGRGGEESHPTSRETSVSVCVVLKLIPLRGAKHFKPRPQSTPPIIYGSFPYPPPPSNKTKTKTKNGLHHHQSCNHYSFSPVSLTCFLYVVTGLPEDIYVPDYV